NPCRFVDPFGLQGPIIRRWFPNWHKGKLMGWPKPGPVYGPKPWWADEEPKPEPKPVYGPPSPYGPKTARPAPYNPGTFPRRFPPPFPKFYAWRCRCWQELGSQGAAPAPDNDRFMGRFGEMVPLMFPYEGSGADLLRGRLFF